MKTIALLLMTALLALAGCGGDDPDPDPAPSEDAAMSKEKDEAAMKKDDAAMSKGTKLVIGDSEFGSMLFDSKKQAIYIFENDERGKSNCYDDCAEAWPPVFTDAKPQAGSGVRAALLGTTKRRDGKLQVTYAGQPLYYYAHEAPGEVKCHNVDLNGGFWWVVGPEGKRRA